MPVESVDGQPTASDALPGPVDVGSWCRWLAVMSLISACHAPNPEVVADGEAAQQELRSRCASSTLVFTKEFHDRTHDDLTLHVRVFGDPPTTHRCDAAETEAIVRKHFRHPVKSVAVSL